MKPYQHEHFPHDRDTPRVSILIPVYRGLPYVATAIRSALEQSYPEVELVIVDDACPESSLSNIGDAFPHDERIRILSHTSNQGVSAAWNTAMEHSRGEFLLRLAQDDVLLSDTVERMVTHLGERKDCDAVYADHWEIDDSGQVREPVRQVAEEADLFRSDFRLGLCVMIRRRVFDSGLRYDPLVRAAEDLDFFVRAFDIGFRFTRLPGGPALYLRKHPGAGSFTQYPRQQLESALILARRECSWRKRSSIYSYRHGEASYCLRNREDWCGALQAAVSGLCHAPFSARLWKETAASVFRIRTGKRILDGRMAND